VSRNASNSPPPLRGADRTIVSLIVQRSTIELFAAYNVAVAPVPIAVPASPPIVRPTDHLVGMVQVTGSDRRGRLTMSTSPVTLARTRQTGPDIRAQLDWMRELTNQFAGRVKSKFARYGLPLQAGLPTALSSSAMARNQMIDGADLVLLFDALRDQILCTLSGGFDDTGLSLQSEAAVADEGQVILF
jgi:hypothetical protein